MRIWEDFVCAKLYRHHFWWRKGMRKRPVVSRSEACGAVWRHAGLKPKCWSCTVVFHYLLITIHDSRCKGPLRNPPLKELTDEQLL
jgi:hypothetical protein